MVTATDTSTMTRDELEERVAELEAELERLDDVDTELQATAARLDALQTRFDRLLTVVLGDRELAEDGLTDGQGLYAHVAGGSDGGFSEAQREQMLPAHRMAVDIRNGHGDRIDGKSSARAAELFRRMLQKVSKNGEPQPGIDNSGGAVTIQSSDAAEMILEFDDSIDTAPSATVTRTFKQLQTLTKHDDCDCDTIADCPHGVVTFHAGSTNKVVSNTARLIQYGEEHGDLAETGGENADDEGNASEDQADAVFQQLDQAEPSNGTANDVVSSHGGPDVSRHEAQTGDDTTR